MIPIYAHMSVHPEENLNPVPVHKVVHPIPQFSTADSVMLQVDVCFPVIAVCILKKHILLSCMSVILSYKIFTKCFYNYYSIE
jgi:hypothetical protein